MINLNVDNIHTAHHNALKTENPLLQRRQYILRVDLFVLFEWRGLFVLVKGSKIHC